MEISGHHIPVRHFETKGVASLHPRRFVFEINLTLFLTINL